MILLLIFCFLKFAPFTSNHWQYRRVSLFLFLSLQGALNWYCTTRASIHFFHWATELLRSALRIRSSTLGCLVFFWPWILLRWGRWWRLDRISRGPRHRRTKHSWLTKAYWTNALEGDLTFKILSPQILEIANLCRRCRCIPLKCWINTGQCWGPGPKPWWGDFLWDFMGFLDRFAPEVRAGALWWAFGANRAKVTSDG